MSILRLAALAPFAIVAATSSASAWQDTSHPYPWDRGCDKDNCFEPYTAYQHGHYSYLKCKDPYKYLTYVSGKLACVPRLGASN